MNASLVFQSAAASDVGRKRTLNEDAVLDRPEIGLWAVADGMGGHGGGDVASHAIVEGLSRIGAPTSAPQLLDDFEARVGEAHDAMRTLAELRGGGVVGSTLAALLIHDANYACVWCGDSRVYRLRDGAFEQLSHDHSEVQELVDRGVLDKAEAKTWPRANVVTRAVGASEQPELEIVDGRVSPGDRFLICSDGLTAHVEDAEIAERLGAPEPRRVCDELVALTLERGARDNVSVVTIFCDANNLTVKMDAPFSRPGAPPI